MRKHDRFRVRKDLGQVPVVEGRVSGSSPLFIERYLFKTIERTVAGLADIALVTQFGGGQVREGEHDHVRSTVVPTQSLLVPAKVATHWHYSSAVDFSVFYFDSQECPLQSRLRRLVATATDPVLFSDPLVGAVAFQLVAEAQRSGTLDDVFSAQLAQVMLEQTYRALTSSRGQSLNPRNVHMVRIGAVLNYIHDNIPGDLSAETLAKCANVSVAHFRRLFQDTVGLPPHRYVHSQRIERARTLLTQSTMPIAMVADQSGFSSQSHLTRCFREVHAITPADFRSRLHQRSSLR